MANTQMGAIADLTRLENLNEETIVKILRDRWQQGNIYTYVGDVTVAVNPYRNINIYGKEQGRLYRDAFTRNECEPHIYWVANHAYQRMLDGKQKQVILISGESGAGKTETTKFIVQHLAYTCNKHTNSLHERIVLVNPLLEAFGNAKTLMNDNSSRFGKLIKLFFNKTGMLRGASIETYLLEKSRVVHHAPGENSFHILYYLVAGASEVEKEQLFIESHDVFRILKPSVDSESHNAIFKDDQHRMKAKENYHKIGQIMQKIGMAREDIIFIYTVLAAILHLTNIEFESKRGFTDGVDIVNEINLEKVSTLLEVDRGQLKDALILKTYDVGGTRNCADRSFDQAGEARDALARSLYQQLFMWLVTKVNVYLKYDDQLSNCRTLGILDMSGFEDLGSNGFDQLLINVANERMQYYFNEHLFSMDQLQLESAGVDLSRIDFYENNSAILTMLLGDRNLKGLLDEVDEVSSQRYATDLIIHDRLKTAFNGMAPFHASLYAGTNFFIQHFAGKVEYDVKNFIQKNRDYLFSNLRDVISQSKNPVVAALINRSSPYPRHHQRTAIAQFKESLRKLINHLSEQESLFVRCIRPNRHQMPNVFDNDLVIQQLRYNGLMELTKMRRMGFPVRMYLNDFLNKYQVLQFRPIRNAPKAECEELLKSVGLQDWQIGNDQIFLKEWHHDQLEKQLRRLIRAVRVVERCYKGHRPGDRFIAVVRDAIQNKRTIRSSSSSLPSMSDQSELNGGRRMTRSPDGSSGGHPEVIGEMQEVVEEALEGTPAPKPRKQALPINHWNVMRTILFESDRADRNADVFVQLLKLLLYLIFCILILAGLVFSKISFLNLTSSISAKMFSTDRYTIWHRNEVITLVLMGLAVPHVIGLVLYGQKAAAGNHAKLSVVTILQMLLVEFAHTIGLIILVLRVLPRTDMVRGVFIMCLSCTTPSVLKVILGKPPIRKPGAGKAAASQDDLESPSDESTRTNVRRWKRRFRLEISAGSQVAVGLWYLFNPIALVIQLLGLIAVTLGRFDAVKSNDYLVAEMAKSGNASAAIFRLSTPLPLNGVRDGLFAGSWEVAVCLVLISVKWWENFVDRDRLSLLTIKANCHRDRHMGTILASILSIVMLCIAPFVCFDNFYFALPGRGRQRLPMEILRDYQSAIIHVGSSFIAYAVSIVVCKLCMQKFCFNLALILATPVAALLIDLRCMLSPVDLGGSIWLCPENISTLSSSTVSQWHLVVMVVFWLSSIIIGADTWWSNQNRIDKTEKLFVAPAYCSPIMEQSMLLNRRRHDHSVDMRKGVVHFIGMEHIENQNTENGVEKPNIERPLPKPPKTNPSMTSSERANMKQDGLGEKMVPMIYACATLWHETKHEMTQLMKSIFRMDKHQCVRRLQKNKIKLYDPEYFDFQTHILFDDAMMTTPDGTKVINQFVKDFLSVINPAGSSVHHSTLKVAPPIRTPTPYGGRLTLKLPGGTWLIVHLKDKDKIRHRKRWSQCMYMYYLLAYRLVGLSDESIWEKREEQLYTKNNILKRLPKEIIDKADNTFILALDGDVDFKPDAVRLLLDLMKKNKNVASACGRIHPIGSGPMVMYQVFGYAIAHWLQKVAEHVYGCVLCSPGCFSMFRGSALMDDNVMHRYLHTADQPREFIQFDQGEDRWLCTLLLQQGYRVEYCAGSDALTFAPETLNEYFTQQRRWITSTMANVLDLISSYETTVERNQDITYLFMLYQVVLFAASLLAPATIVTLIAGSYNSILGTPLLYSYLLGFSVALFYTMVCMFCKNDTQIKIGTLISAVYAIVMMLVLVAMIVNSSYDSIHSPNVAFLAAITLLFLLLGLLHPREITCLLPGILYIFAIPFSLLFLIIYSICNLNVVSWGTREVRRAKTQEELDQEQMEEDEKKERSKNSGILNLMGLGNVVSDIKEFTKVMLTRSTAETRVESTILEKVMVMEERLNELVSKKQKPKNELQNILARKASQTKQKSNSESKINAEKNQKDLPPEPEDVNNPSWMDDELLKNGKCRHISIQEQDFWTDLLSLYLHPIPSNIQKEKQIANELKEMRNNVVAGMAMLNVLWIILIFLFQTLKETLGEAIFIPIPQENGGIEFFEPVGLVFLSVFGMLLIVQFSASLWHRMTTIMHLIAITIIKWPWVKFEDSDSKLLEDTVKLVSKLASPALDDELASQGPVSDDAADELEEQNQIREEQQNREDQLGNYSRLEQVRPSAQHRPYFEHYRPHQWNATVDRLDASGIPSGDVDLYRPNPEPSQAAKRRRNQVQEVTGGALNQNFNRRYRQLQQQLSHPSSNNNPQMSEIKELLKRVHPH